MTERAKEPADPTREIVVIQGRGGEWFDLTTNAGSRVWDRVHALRRIRELRISPGECVRVIERYAHASGGETVLAERKGR